MEKNSDQAACNGGDQHDDPVDNMDEESAAKAKLTADDSSVKFTSINLDNKNGDAKVAINIGVKTVGMGKEELMKYANEPFWVRLRMILFLLFWILWVAMLVGAVVIIFLAPRCPPAPKVEWYQKSPIYQVDVETFKDSDGSGVGDLKGLASRLDYLKDQNIHALMLGAFYESDEQGGVIDHKAVNSKFGTQEDFDDLVNKLKEKDIRLVIDFNPNHSSDRHSWFMNSIEGQDPYKDFYVWADAAPTGGVPNNWLNIHGKSAWTWSKDRNQYYLSTFGENLPDLNLRNELVRQELRDIVTFWMEKGADGLKVIAASHLIENIDLRDEAVNTPGPRSDNTQYKDYNHVYTVDLPENLGLFAEWKEILKNFTESTGIPKILMPQLSGSLNTSMLYYGNETAPLAELPFNNHFTELNKKTDGFELKEHVDMWMNHVPSNGWPTLLVGSKDVPRLASRVGDELVDAIHMVAIFAKGTPIMYYADELGVTDITLNNKTTISQTVMLWNNESFSGFTNGSTSLHVHPNYQTLNAQVQEKNKQSHLKIFSRLLALRGQPALNFGLQEYPLITNETFSLMRVRKGSPGYLVVINLGDQKTHVDFTDKSKYLPEMARVEIRSSNVVAGPLAEGDHPKIALNDINLDAKQAVVFSFVPIFEG